MTPEDKANLNARDITETGEARIQQMIENMGDIEDGVEYAFMFIAKAENAVDHIHYGPLGPYIGFRTIFPSTDTIPYEKELIATTIAKKFDCQGMTLTRMLCYRYDPENPHIPKKK